MLKNLAKKVYPGRHSIIAVVLVLSGVALVACSNGGGSSGGSTNTAVTTKAFGLAARARDQTIMLSWPRINDAKKYNLYWSLTSGVTKKTGTKIADATAPYKHRGLSNGVPVYYVYTVETSAGEGAESLEITLAPGANVSGAPDVDAFGADGRVELFWCCVSGATSYNVYLKTARGESFGAPILTDATSPAVITGLQNDQGYYFAVTTVTGGKESVPSNEAVAITYAPELLELTSGDVPKTPRNVYAYAGHSQATIYAHDQGDVLRYTIFWRTSDNQNGQISNVALPYTHTGLTNGTIYYYRISAQNQHGESEPSREISNIPNNDSIAGLVTDYVVDTKLRNCIILSAAYYGWTYQRQLETVNCNNQGDINLSGLDKFSNLSYFYLGQSGGTATTVSNIDILSNLVNLNELNLRGDGIVNVSFLSGLTNLAQLDLGRNQITSISPLEPLLNLEGLYLDNNRFNDLMPLRSLDQLTALWVGHPADPASRISTLEPLRNLTALTDLRFENNAIDASGLEPLSKLTNLQKLFFTNNNVVSLDALKGMAQLQEIQAGFNKISDIHLADINGLPKLEVLNLESNAVVKDVSSLATLTKLRELNLSNNQVDNLSPLAAMTSLTTLNLNGNLVVNASPLANLYSLQNLNLSNNQIGGANVGRVDRLADLTRATYIGLGGNSAMSCVELVTLVEARGSPPVDLDGVPGSVDVPTAGVNCTNPP